MKQTTKLDAVKDIIFGDEIHDFKQQLTELRSLIDTLLEQQDQSSRKFFKELNALKETQKNDLNNLLKRVDNLEANTADKTALGKTLVKLGQKLQNGQKK